MSRPSAGLTNDSGMELLYFDFYHGMARELSINLDRQTRKIQFHFERSPDPSYDEDNVGVERVSVIAAITCPDLPTFNGFIRALVTAMRETPFSLQNPSRPPFESMPHHELKLEGISADAPLKHSECRIPAKIVAELLSPDGFAKKFEPIICIPQQWKPDQFWYESDEAGVKRTLNVRFDEEALTIVFESHHVAGRGAVEGSIEERTESATLICPDLAQMHGILHALAEAMCDAGRYSSAYVMGKYAGKRGGRRFRPAKIRLDEVAEIVLKYVPIGPDRDKLTVRIPSTIVSELIPPRDLEEGQIPEPWIPIVSEAEFR
jgi:hypothetical protein